ncbi:MAG: interleukin-like EMT inducer domain-containing protein, partial [bacterium]
EWQNREIFPFMTGMSCHSARFTNPTINSLSESYFIHPMGATAYWGSSGFGYITQDFFLLEGIFTAVARDTVRSVGEATTFAKWHIWQRLGDQKRSRFVINQYTLIGDPAMDLVIPEKPELAVSAGDIKFSSNLLLTTDSTTTVSATIQNYGLVPLDSVQALVTASDPEENVLLLGQERIPPFGNVDSMSVTWNIPDEPGRYLVQVEVDPEDVIAEEDELNNRAERRVNVYASDLTLIKPLDFGVVTTPTPELVSNNSRVFSEDLVYYFEIDTSSQFNSPMLQQSPAITEGKLRTKWQPRLSLAGVYYWRVRTFDGSNYGPWQRASLSYLPESLLQWQQSHQPQFNQNLLKDVVTDASGSITLQPTRIVFEAESAGFLDGNHAFLWRNNEFFSESKRGHNLAVFDETDGRFLARSGFDTFEEVVNAEAMAQFINDLPFGRMVLAAIQDEGSASMTENAYLALESIGSALTRQVGFRDSWAIIGRKGAAIGSVPEAMSKSGQGPVAVSDTLYRFVKSGKMVSPEIGPALEWKALSLSYSDSPPDEHLTFQIVGLNAQSGIWDSLMTNISGVNQVDMSSINAKAYPKIKLVAILSTETGLNSPQLHTWALDFVPPPDLVLGKGSVAVSVDTVFGEANVAIRMQVGNFGLSSSDSFSIRLYRSGPQKNDLEFDKLRIPGIAVDEIKEYSSVLSTAGLSGKVKITVEVDSEREIPEIEEHNNSWTSQIWVARDTLAPEIRVTFDGREVGEGEFVSANPEIVAEIRDKGSLAIVDTAQIEIFLDSERVVYGTGPGQAQLIPQEGANGPDLKALVLFKPQLTEGEHILEIIAKDGLGNFSYFQNAFVVSSEFLIANVMNYPNPFVSETDFTYILTQPADRVRIKIYTISGRLIREIDLLPTRVGFNQFHWNGRDHDKDFLANGVYLYKIIARKGDQQVEIVEKFVVMR